MPHAPAFGDASHVTDVPLGVPTGGDAHDLRRPPGREPIVRSRWPYRPQPGIVGPDAKIPLAPAMDGNCSHRGHGVPVLRECRALGVVEWTAVRPVCSRQRSCCVTGRPERLDRLADRSDGSGVLRDRGNDGRLAVRPRAGGQRISADIRSSRAAGPPGEARGHDARDHQIGVASGQRGLPARRHCRRRRSSPVCVRTSVQMPAGPTRPRPGPEP